MASICKEAILKMGAAQLGEREGPRSENEGRPDAKESADERETAALRSRLDRLSADLGAAREAPPSGGAEGSAPEVGSIGTAMSLGFRVLAEFVSAVVVGALLGWQLDKWIGTTPLFLLVFLLLGTAAGFWNVYRIAVNRKGLGP
ncbi:conserved hypothetical protein [Methylocella silvestris BL2]|uniref:ATP synthase protein I n=1 Tax=Methylocella silvestris (strain DSM 15510 / CIP 108128 / LMG 27833 / NCIMB 13906 / BL2) TaxID=395965 RepID=B8EMM6_METSB|nr:AtpZ/AtpI family protein [Methylocella silvestris]ACK52705.1 conserved hypothetical protein [Methylocella silvestris BL2]